MRRGVSGVPKRERRSTSPAKAGHYAQADYFSSSIFIDFERALPSDGDDLVVAPPPDAFLEPGLHDAHGRCRASVGAQVTSSAIGPIGSPSGGSQNASATKKPRPASNCMTVPRNTPPSRPEHLVAIVGRPPFDGIRTEHARRGDRARHAPPGAERVGIEERAHHERRRRGDADRQVQAGCGLHVLRAAIRAPSCGWSRALSRPSRAPRAAASARDRGCRP